MDREYKEGDIIESNIEGYSIVRVGKGWEMRKKGYEFTPDTFSVRFDDFSTEPPPRD